MDFECRGNLLNGPVAPRFMGSVKSARASTTRLNPPSLVALLTTRPRHRRSHPPPRHVINSLPPRLSSNNRGFPHPNPRRAGRANRRGSCSHDVPTLPDGLRPVRRLESTLWTRLIHPQTLLLRPRTEYPSISFTPHLRGHADDDDPALHRTCRFSDRGAERGTGLRKRRRKKRPTRRPIRSSTSCSRPLRKTPRRPSGRPCGMRSPKPATTSHMTWSGSGNARAS